MSSEHELTTTGRRVGKAAKPWDSLRRPRSNRASSPMSELNGRESPAPSAAVAAAAPAKKAQQSAALPTNAADAGGASFDWLLQRQLEVEMSLRGSPLAKPQGVPQVRETFARLAAFFTELPDVGAVQADLGLKAPPGFKF